MGSKGPGEVQAIVDPDTAPAEDLGEVRRDMDLNRYWCTANRIGPLPKTRLFTEVDLLTLANQADDDRPPRESGRDVDDEFWLGLLDPLPLAHPMPVPGALRFIEHENVVVRQSSTRSHL